MLHESQLPQACDRCYALKERCNRLAGAATCERCGRLDLPCRANRPFKRPGRRPRQDQHDSVKGRSRQSSVPGYANDGRQLSLPTLKEGQVAVPSSETTRLGWILADDDSAMQFVLGPSFCKAHRETLISQLLTSHALLQDAYLACALSLPAAGEDASTPLDDERLNTSYRRASAGLSALSTLQVQATYEMSSCLVLGGLLLTFALRMGGEEALVICGKTLSLVKPVYESRSAGSSSDDLPFLVCLIMTEIAECLLRTRAPTLRFRPQTPPCVDPFLGICTTLLPLLHDLAHLSYEMSKMDDGVPDERLDCLEEAVNRWRPEVPEEMAKNCTSTEVCHMLCQAQVMQTAALIIIHRLRYPYGTEQAAASAMASSILCQLDMTRLVTGRTPRSIDLPLVVACLELRDDDERSRYIKSTSSIAAFSLLFQDRAQAMLSAVWAARERDATLYWYNLGPILSAVR